MMSTYPAAKKTILCIDNDKRSCATRKRFSKGLDTQFFRQHWHNRDFDLPQCAGVMECSSTTRYPG